MLSRVIVLSLLCAVPVPAAAPQGKPANEALEIGLAGWTVSMTCLVNCAMNRKSRHGGTDCATPFALITSHYTRTKI